MTAGQPEGVGQQQVCGRTYRSGSGRYYDCGRAVGHGGGHLPWSDPAPSPTPPARDSGPSALAVAMTNMTIHTGASRTQVAELVRLARQAGPDTAVVDERIAAALALHPATVRGKATMASARYCPEDGMPIPCATRTALTGGTP